MKLLEIEACTKASETDLVAFEHMSGQQIPLSYRHFLRDKCNGGCPVESIYFFVPNLCDGAELQGLYGVRNDGSPYDFATAYDVRIRTSSEFFLFGYDSTGGNLYIKQGTGEVYYHAHDIPAACADSEMSIVAASFEQFLASLLDLDSLEQAVNEARRKCSTP